MAEATAESDMDAELNVEQELQVPPEAPYLSSSASYICSYTVWSVKRETKA